MRLAFLTLCLLLSIRSVGADEPKEETREQAKEALRKGNGRIYEQGGLHFSILDAGFPLDEAISSI
jgi:hypothetical protein